MTTIIILYNIIQLLALLLLLPLLAAWALAPKYRSRIAGRLGIALPELSPKQEGRPRIWIHALSVGEVASSLPLVRAIRTALPHSEIIFSTTTRSGADYARRMADQIDLFVPFPLDFYWTVKKFISHLSPDLFILIETDFWPNILWQLSRRKVPCLLANGRITEHSFKAYGWAAFLFGPLFNSFTCLSMQIEEDARRMMGLGVAADKVVSCGNLKYDLPQSVGRQGTKSLTRAEFNLPTEGPLLVAGSTHAGEEEIIIKAFKQLLGNYPDLSLIIAPRDVNRSNEIAGLISKSGLTCTQRSRRTTGEEAILLLDTLGELSQVYALANIAFVGGSLVPEGGHNPLEPAVFGKPILFGLHMQDFAEISLALLQAGAAKEITAWNIKDILNALLADKRLCLEMGEKAAGLIKKNQGAAERYLEIIKKLLPHVQESPD